MALINIPCALVAVAITTSPSYALRHQKGIPLQEEEDRQRVAESILCSGQGHLEVLQEDFRKSVCSMDVPFVISVINGGSSV